MTMSTLENNQTQNKQTYREADKTLQQVIEFF